MYSGWLLPVPSAYRPPPPGTGTGPPGLGLVGGIFGAKLVP